MKNESSQEKIRVRFAPSPTGMFHIGTARTALFNYLFAKKNKGEFVLRIEDTDLEKSDKKYEKNIIECMEWLGLKWDKGPFRQSERNDIYEKYIKKLLDSEQAFYCNHTKEELEKEKKEQMSSGQAPKHICEHRNKGLKKGIIRFHCSEEKIVFNDLIKDKLEFDGSLFGDIGIARDEKTPLYNLAVVIDDGEMEISHVIRGEDHISNTPKQILILRALGFKEPKYAHMPLTLGSDKTKLSKRHGATSITEYKKDGYLPEAMINFMVFLGWHPGQGEEKEVFSLEELIKEFSLEKVNKSNAIFNIEKLDWYNSHYIKKMDLDELTKKCLPYLNLNNKDSSPLAQNDIASSQNDIKKIIALEQERIKKLSEIEDLTKFFFVDKLDYSAELLIWKKMTLEEVKNNLNILEKTLSKTEKFDQKSLEDTLMPLTKECGVGELLWPLRVALTGQKASPGPFEIMEILGKKRTLKRIKEAMDKSK
ncbi:MAG: glutamate--tRNA ligase [bacterium]